MTDIFSDRRRFLKNTAVAASAMVAIPWMPKSIAEYHSVPLQTIYDKPRIRFAAIGINHGHITAQIDAVKRGGGELVSFYASEPDLAAAFAKNFPGVLLAKSKQEILDDKSIQLVVSAAIPNNRAPLGIEVMRHGKDFMADKPGIISLEQLKEVRKVQKETNRIYSIMYSERLESKSTIKAGELVKAGAIGKVINTIGMGPHRLSASTRPPWFFEKEKYGGILCDILTHQSDQFLFLTNSKSFEIVASQVGNYNHKDHPGLEDFGDAMVRGNNCSGYMRVDWFTPDSLGTWGDSRLTILGTEGYIEIRKNIDIAGRKGTNHLILVNNKETKYVDSSSTVLSYGPQLVDDILNRTETAMSQEHCFLATELALTAQIKANIIT
ncbi:MAG: Gfo/Idh/MocA family oxidoreductase [Flavitalea sp.]